MWIIPALTALITSAAPTEPAPTELANRIAAVSAPEDVACYEVAKGRASVPIRENYFTFSPIVGSVSRGQLFLGRRVEGENKVLVLTPHAAGSIGIARFTFTREVEKERCSGDKLYAPEYNELQAWTPPLPGEVEAPRSPGRIFSTFGCYTTIRKTALKVPQKGDASIELPNGQLFFAGYEDESGKYRNKLVVLDASGGAELGTVVSTRVKRVGLAECAGAAAFSGPQ